MRGSPPLDTLLFDPKEFSFLTGANFRGLSITEAPLGWNIVLRAFLNDGAAVYAMAQHEDPREGLLTLLAVLATKSGADLWRRDKFYKD